MKILVLGGTGAMGVNLVDIFAERGEEITVTSRSPRKSAYENVTYVQGDAHDLKFLDNILRKPCDVIIDFMVYNTEEFKARRDLLLGSTTQYVFLSSGRVYAGSKKPITEDFPRLLDGTTDKVYLRTDEYALTKARQENLLFESGKDNWTIVRPYITYSSDRLQLGVFEKEVWLYRALHGQTIVFPNDIADRTTTLTCGEDVALGIALLAGNSKAYGKVFHITTSESIRWREVLELYQRVFYEVTGSVMKVKMVDTSVRMGEAMGNHYQIKYDRLFDRMFDNEKITRLIGGINFVPTKDGLERCLRKFLEAPRFRNISITKLVWMDKETGEKTRLAYITSSKSKIKYVLFRYVPENLLYRMKAIKK